MISELVLPGLMNVLVQGGLNVPVYSVYGPPSQAGSTAPYVLLTLVSDSPRLYFGDADDYEMRIQVDVYTPYQDGAVAGRRLAGLVYKLFHKRTHVIEDVSSCSSWSALRQDTRYESERYYRTMLQFRVVGTE